MGEPSLEQEVAGSRVAGVPVSAIIAARNEAHDITACIRSLSWADEILVVENDSSDDTINVARAAGADVFSHPFATIGAQRNAAIARARHSWIFVVDADESCTPGVEAAVTAAIAQPSGPSAWRIRRRNYFLGKEVRHGGWERDCPVRLFRCDLRYDEKPVHEHVVTSGQVGTLGAHLLHTPYATLSEYFEKLERYSRGWAERQHAGGQRASMTDVTVRPFLRFLTMLIARNGWRDGAHGVVLAVLTTMSVAAKYAQLWAISRESRSPKP